MKLKIEELLESHRSKVASILRSFETYNEFMFDRLIHPTLIKKGPSYKYENQYKIQIQALKNEEYYKEMKRKYKVLSTKEMKLKLIKQKAKKENLIKKLNSNDT